MQALLRLGADPQAPGFNGKTPAQIATANSKLAIVEVLHAATERGSVVASGSAGAFWKPADELDAAARRAQLAAPGKQMVRSARAACIIIATKN